MMACRVDREACLAQYSLLSLPRSFGSRTHGYSDIGASFATLNTVVDVPMRTASTTCPNPVVNTKVEACALHVQHDVYSMRHSACLYLTSCCLRRQAYKPLADTCRRTSSKAVAYLSIPQPCSLTTLMTLRTRLHGQHYPRVTSPPTSPLPPSSKTTKPSKNPSLPQQLRLTHLTT